MSHPALTMELSPRSCSGLFLGNTVEAGSCTTRTEHVSSGGADSGVRVQVWFPVDRWQQVGSTP